MLMLHVRIYKPRPQVVYAFSPNALETNRDFYNGVLMLWIRQGFFRGIYDGNTYFTEKINNTWYDTYSNQYTKDVDGYRFSPEGGYAVARLGDRIMVAPRSDGLSDCFGADYGQMIPVDEGSVIGYIIAVNGSQVTVRVESCPTGLAKDVVVQDVVVNLDGDAEYHLNGIRNSLKDDAIKVGNFVRILSNINNGMILARLTGTVGQSKMFMSSQPTIHAIMPTNNPLIFSNDVLNKWQQADTIFTTENQTVYPEVYVWTSVSTQIEWFRNGIAVPGTKKTISSSQLCNISEYADISDNGAIFTCNATTSEGTTVSDPIVLIVSADTSPLLIQGAVIGDKNTIQLTYNKEVQVGMGVHGAENLSNYSINNGITISNIVLIGDKKTVIITTSDMTSGNDYIVTVNNVQDVSYTPNQIANNSQITVSYTVKFRYFRFSIKAKGSLTPRVEEMRYITKGVQYGTGKTYFDLADSYKAYDNSNATYCQINLGQFIGLDMGAGYEILPDTLKIDASGGSGRNIYGFKVEGSNDQATWTLLMDRNDTTLGTVTTPYYFAFDNSALDPDSILVGAKQAQTISFPAIGDQDISNSPITLNATASSGLPITYYVIQGPAIVYGNQLTLTDTGLVWVRATQEGNTTYYSAYPQDQTFTVSGDIPTHIEDATIAGNKISF